MDERIDESVLVVLAYGKNENNRVIKRKSHPPKTVSIAALSFIKYKFEMLSQWTHFSQTFQILFFFQMYVLVYSLDLLMIFHVFSCTFYSILTFELINKMHR